MKYFKVVLFSLALLLGATVVSSQDLTTRLSLFLTDLYSGVLGNTLPITAIRTGNGSAAVPSYTFLSETTLGLLRSSAGIIGMAGLEANPVAPTVALAGAGAGNVNNGAHTYVETCVTAGGQTSFAAGPVATIADKTVNGQVTVTLKPCSPTATGRNLYRSAAGTTTPLFLVAASPVITDGQVTTAYTDNIADASLQVTQAPATNTASDVRYTFPKDGVGVPRVVGRGRSLGLGTATGQLTIYTPAVDGTFEVTSNVLVTTATTHTFTVECAYTDEGNTARTATLSFMLLAGGTPTTSIVNTNGAVPYQGIPITIRAKGGTSILVRTQAAGTYTTVVYNFEAIVVQIF